jgi:hypothetical protein
MAQIKDASSFADGLAVQAASKAAHARLMDDNGRALAKLPADLWDATSRSLPMSGVVASSNQVTPLAVDRAGALRSATLTPLVSDPWSGSATVNPVIWQVLQSTMALSQNSVTGLVFNTGLLTTAATGLAIKSTRRVTKQPGTSLLYRASARISKTTNTIVELGFGDCGAGFGGNPTALLDNTVGAYWRFSNAGTLIPVLTFNSVDVATGTNVAAQPNTTDFYDYLVYVEDLGFRFLILSKLGVVVSEQYLANPVGMARELAQPSLSAIVQLRNSATAPATAPSVSISTCFVGRYNSNEVFSPAELSATMGYSASTLVSNGGVALVGVTSGAALTPITLTTTTTAGGNTLGGRTIFNAIAGTENDLGLFALTNTDVVSSGMTWMLTGYRIEIGVGVTPIATTPTLIEPFLLISDSNNPASALARKMPLGSLFFPVGTVVGDIRVLDVTLEGPVALVPTRTVGVGLRIPLATATAGQTFRATVTPKGYWVS